MILSADIGDLNISIGSVGGYGHAKRCLHSIYAEDEPGSRFLVTVVYNAPASIDDT